MADKDRSDTKKSKPSTATEDIRRPKAANKSVTAPATPSPADRSLILSNYSVFSMSADPAAAVLTV